MSDTSSARDATSAVIQNQWKVPYYIRGLALGIPIYLAAIHLWTWVLYVPDSLARGGYDFRQSYSAAYMLRTGHGSELYDYDAQKRFQDQLVSPQNIPLPFVEPPYEALLFQPFSLFSFRTGYFLLLAVNVGLLCACVRMLRPWLANIRFVYWWLPTVMFIGFLPSGVALIQGQDAIVLTTTFVAAFVLLSKGREFLAGVVLGMGIFKFQIVLPVAFLFLLWRHWRFVLGCGMSAAACLGVGFWAVGLSQTKAYFSLLLSLAGLQPPLPGFSSYPVYWNGMACLHGIVFALAQGRASHKLLMTATLVLSAAVLAWTALRGFRIAQPSTQLLLAILCSILVGHHVNIYDMSILMLPTFVTLNEFLPREPCGTRADRITALIAALMFASPVAITFFPSHFSVLAFVELAFLVAIASVGSEDFGRERIQVAAVR